MANFASISNGSLKNVPETRLIRPCKHTTVKPDFSTKCSLVGKSCDGFNTACPMYEAGEWDHIEKQRNLVFQAMNARSCIDILDKIHEFYYPEVYSDELWKRALEEIKQSSGDIKQTLKRKLRNAKHKQVMRIVKLAVCDALKEALSPQSQNIRMTKSEKELYEKIRALVEKHMREFLEGQ